LILVRNFQAVSRVAGAVITLVLAGVWAVNAASTWDDYFNKWPNHPETQFVFQADFAAIAKDIDTSNVMDVSVGGLSNDTLDDLSLYLLRQRKDVRVRWFDSGSPISSGGALVQPMGSPARMYIPTIVPLIPQLDQFNAFFAPRQTDHFRRYEIKGAFDAAPDPAKARVFDDTAILLGMNPDQPLTIAAGQTLDFETRWLARDPVAYPRRVFVHVVDRATGTTIAQHDGLDAPTKFWRAGDWIAQQHILSIPVDTPAGLYEVQIGLYDPVTGQRVLQTDYDRAAPPSDHFVLSTIEVTH
jgi:hypothetical protein